MRKNASKNRQKRKARVPTSASLSNKGLHASKPMLSSKGAVLEPEIVIEGREPLLYDMVLSLPKLMKRARKCDLTLCSGGFKALSADDQEAAKKEFKNQYTVHPMRDYYILLDWRAFAKFDKTEDGRVLTFFVKGEH